MVEAFSEDEAKILSRYVTHTTSNIFVLHNLPEVVKGALFSRYSRSKLGLRALLLKEFILNEEASFSAMTGSSTNQEFLEVAVKKAQNFYDRILDGYGDDSIGELGGAHLAIENISMVATKFIEDCRIGGSPLEKSTRYVCFDQKLNGEYLFYREPTVMASPYRDLYLNSCNHLFRIYSELVQDLTEVMQKKVIRDPSVSNGSYTAALRAKVLDCLRGLLPASTLTNMGIYGNGRFFETLIQKLNSHNFFEFQDIGLKSYQELNKVIPSFIRRGENSHKHQHSFSSFMEQLNSGVKTALKRHANFLNGQTALPFRSGVKLVDYDSESPYKVAAALLFSSAKNGLSELLEGCRNLTDEALSQVLETASQNRENRRHKSPRALEQATFTFEIVSDFGVYRDLQRHRMLTQDRQLLTCDLGYFFPEELIDTPMAEKYTNTLDRAKEAYEIIVEKFPEEAQYAVPMAYHIRWYFHVNLRSLQWICELRSSAAGHSGYRLIAQELARQVSTVLPQFERFFKFVDFDGYEIGRLGQEIRTEKKKLSKVL